MKCIKHVTHQKILKKHVNYMALKNVDVKQIINTVIK